jgi:hypothetical protein
MITKRSVPADPGRQPIKGVFVFQKEDGVPQNAEQWMKLLDCQVLRSTKTQLIVQSSRRNLQTIKKRWCSLKQTNTIEDALPANIAAIYASLDTDLEQLLIGGSV